MGTSEEGSMARNQSTLKKEEKISMMKTFCLLILICSILDIGISKPNKHFLVETDDTADVDEAGIDYQGDKKSKRAGKVKQECQVNGVDFPAEKCEEMKKNTKEWFDLDDKDGSGTISLKEAAGESEWNLWKNLTEKERNLWRNLGPKGRKSWANIDTRKDVKWVEERTAWLKDNDKNGDGVIEFSEFWDSFYDRTEDYREKERKRRFNEGDWDDSETLTMEE